LGDSELTGAISAVGEGKTVSHDSPGSKPLAVRRFRYNDGFIFDFTDFIEYLPKI
jgi:hypothetical protein